MAKRHLWFAAWLVALLAPASVLADDAPAVGDASADVEAADADSDPERPRVPVWRPQGDLLGDLGMMTTRYEDTFAALGTRLGLGYLELVKANPEVDPWLPGDGTAITLPRRYVLPEGRRQGLVVNLAEYRLYHFRDDGVAVYPVGVGTEENPSPVTDARVTMRLESPAWYPPKSIRAEYEAAGEFLPRMIPPGPENPLGSHALLLSEAGYLIHGTNKRFGVGMQVSHGCFRMYNQDIATLAREVADGTTVQVVDQPVKVGFNGDEVWLEVHRPTENYRDSDRERLWQQVSDRLEQLRQSVPGVEIQRHQVELAVQKGDGIPRMVGERLPQLASGEDSGRTDSVTPSPEAASPAAEPSPPVQQLWF
ncbi:L,D-transpeptidase family protein [Marinobacter xestospongiae]|uniref:L,D-transpeptidase family protein n=1 Tax=Marinobacter xestospongiae TaxID=994319 RepID=UPI002003BDE6|nr:L,D-transpeptidase family protein [Marinobacter xestospongiae]MCK7567506.1 L,D-transpeptidase family protein [Marinobacter xestospongiae]